MKKILSFITTMLLIFCMLGVANQSYAEAAPSERDDFYFTKTREIPGTTVIKVGEEIYLGLEIPEGISEDDITYEISEEMATVTKEKLGIDGKAMCKVTAKKAGNVVVYAYINITGGIGFRADYEFRIVEVVDSQEYEIIFDKEEYSLLVDEIEQIKLDVVSVFAPTTAPITDKCELSYKTENDKIATVDENGIITGVSAGNTNIIVTAKYKLDEQADEQVYIASVAVNVEKSSTEPTNTVNSIIISPNNNSIQENSVINNGGSTTTIQTELENNVIDNTTATTKLPKTGRLNMIGVIGIVAIVGVVCYISYIRYKKI